MSLLISTTNKKMTEQPNSLEEGLGLDYVACFVRHWGMPLASWLPALSPGSLPQSLRLEQGGLQLFSSSISRFHPVVERSSSCLSPSPSSSALRRVWYRRPCICRKPQGSLVGLLKSDLKSLDVSFPMGSWDSVGGPSFPPRNLLLAALKDPSKSNKYHIMGKMWGFY